MTACFQPLTTVFSPTTWPASPPAAIDNAAEAAGVVTIVDSTLVDNTVPADLTGASAGAILNLGTMIISDSTLTGNSAGRA